MGENKNTPKIRFKGFTEAWEQRKLNEISKYITSNYTVSDSVNSGKYDLYDANNVIGKVNNKIVKEEYITIIKDGSGVGKVRRLPKNTAFIGTMGGILPKYSDIDFIYCSLLKTDFTKEINGATIPHIYYSNYGNNEYLIPKLNEQVKLGKFFSEIDNLITLHQSKYDNLLMVKKSMLEKMFPKDDEKIPKWRFKEFTDVWGQRKFTDFVEFFNGQTYSPLNVQENGTLVLRSSNVQNGEITKENSVFIDSKVVNTNNVKIGDIIVVVRNGSRNLIGKHAQIKENMPNTVIGAFMTGIRTTNSNFVNSLLNTPNFDNEINKNMGATINQITGYMFSNMEFKIPIDQEQERIGKLFYELDNLITLHQSKIEKLNNIKKSLLEKMFV